MYLTENEALRLTCPLKDEKCKAAKCPAWRWAYVDIEGGVEPLGGVCSPKGYCGMGGRPEEKRR